MNVIENFTWRELDKGNDIYTCVAFPSHGGYFAVGDEDGTISIYSCVSCIVCIKTLSLDKTRQLKKKGQVMTGDAICSISWSYDGTRIASGSADGVLRMWDVVNGELLSTTRISTSRIGGIHWNPNSACNNDILLVCPLREPPMFYNYKLKKSYPARMLIAPTSNGISFVAAVYDSNGYLYTCDNTGMVRKYSQYTTDDPILIKETKLARDSVSKSGHRPMQINSDGTTLYVGSMRGVKAITTDTMELLDDYADMVNEAQFEHFVLSSDKNNKVIGICDKWSGQSSSNIYVWQKNPVNVPDDAPSDTPKFKIDSQVTKIKELQFLAWCPTGDWMVVISRFGVCYSLRNILETGWAGPMFPVGFGLLTDNSYYKEREDEYDLVPDQMLNTGSENNSSREGSLDKEKDNIVDICDDDEDDNTTININTNTYTTSSNNILNYSNHHQQQYRGLNRPHDLFIPSYPLEEECDGGGNTVVSTSVFQISLPPRGIDISSYHQQGIENEIFDSRALVTIPSVNQGVLELQDILVGLRKKVKQAVHPVQTSTTADTIDIAATIGNATTSDTNTTVLKEEKTDSRHEEILPKHVASGTTTTTTATSDRSGLDELTSAIGMNEIETERDTDSNINTVVTTTSKTTPVTTPSDEEDFEEVCNNNNNNSTSTTTNIKGVGAGEGVATVSASMEEEGKETISRSSSDEDDDDVVVPPPSKKARIVSS